MLNLAIDSKLRGCDLVSLKIDDLCVGGRLRDRATIIQKKTGRPVQFELTEQTRASVEDWLATLKIRDGRFLFPSRVHEEPHISTRQYARIVHGWVRSAGLDDSAYGTHSMRRRGRFLQASSAYARGNFRFSSTRVIVTAGLDIETMFGVMAALSRKL